MSVLERVAPFARVQVNAWSCGPSALRHAILAYGKRVDARIVAKLAGTSRDGTNEKQLANAAFVLGFKLDHVHCRNERLARKAIREFAASETPVLICLDRAEHWATVVSVSSRHVDLLDSSRPGPPVQRVTWRTLLGRACFWHPGSTVFDLYPLLPASK